MLRWLHRLALGGRLRVVYADESAFKGEPNVPYGWIPVGKQRALRSAKQGNLNVFGLLDLNGDLTSYVTEGSIDSQRMVAWLDDYAGGLEGRTVVILDNASYHTSAMTKARIKAWRAAGLYLYFLPTYCPHLNLIETLWRKMKHEWLRPKDYRSKAALHKRVKKLLQKYGNGIYDIDFELTI